MNIALCFDQDSAGIAATERAANRIQDFKFWYKNLEHNNPYLWSLFQINGAEPNCDTLLFRYVDNLIQEELDLISILKNEEYYWKNKLQLSLTT